jgi:arylsulfatase A-like enzyme
MRTGLLGFVLALVGACASAAERPNIVLVMTDDQGWGEMGYYDHPVLRTPNLDAMAASGLRFDRFYAGAPNCSPTRATVMTGRSNDRTGVLNHGYPLRKQEKTLAQALRGAGYATGHFGKWHLSGFRGRGVPILKNDTLGPGFFGFDQWLSVTNFFDRDPLMSRNGEFERFEGDSSEIVVAESLKFIRTHAAHKTPFLAVIWYGSPHSPFRASMQDRAAFGELNTKSQNHYGELVAMDRSIGTLRKGLRDLGIAADTLVWFCSDNGGLRGIQPATVGGLRGHKGTVFEGGLRVPAIVEWPAVITQPRIAKHPAATMDIFPTIVEIAGLAESVMVMPCDGMSLRALFDSETGPRTKPLPFRHTQRAAWIDNDYKLLTENLGRGEFQLYNLAEDPKETTNILANHPEIGQRMTNAFQQWNREVEASMAGADYPEGRLLEGRSEPKNWASAEEYRPYLNQLNERTP